MMTRRARRDRSKTSTGTPKPIGTAAAGAFIAAITLAMASIFAIAGCLSDFGFGKPEPADNSYCCVCHINFKKEELARTHQPVGVGCENCHGPSDAHSSDEDNLTPPEKMYTKQKINSYCMTCHTKRRLAKVSDHKPLLAGKSKEKTCTGCHGNHRLKVRTRIWDKNSGKLISDDGVRMMYDKRKGGGK